MAGSQQKQGPDLSALALFGLGTELAVTVVLGMVAGYYLDRWLGSGPWCLVVGTLLGSVVGMYQFVKRVTAVTKRRNGTRS